MKWVTQIVVLAFVPVLVSGCARRSSLESAQARLAESQGQLSKAEQDLLRTKDELSDAKARLKEANERIAELQGRLSLLKLVPVRVRFKPAPPGLGQVMVITSTSKLELPIKVTITRPNFGVIKTYELSLPPLSSHEILLDVDLGTSVKGGLEVQVSNPAFETYRMIVAVPELKSIPRLMPDTAPPSRF